MVRLTFAYFFFFFNDTATTEIYTLSLHDALPICSRSRRLLRLRSSWPAHRRICRDADRKSTRLNSSHSQISYAVFCLKKKKKNLRPFPYYIISNTASAPLYSLIKVCLALRFWPSP